MAAVVVGPRLLAASPSWVSGRACCLPPGTDELSPISTSESAQYLCTPQEADDSVPDMRPSTYFTKM